MEVAIRLACLLATLWPQDNGFAKAADGAVDCPAISKQFTDAGLKVDRFRDFAIPTTQLAKEISGPTEDDSYNGRPQKSFRSSMGVTEVETLRMEAGRVCGFIKRPTETFGKSASYSPAQLLQMLKEDYEKANANQIRENAMVAEYSKIALDKPYEETRRFTYPDMKGKLKEDAQQLRKVFFQASFLTMVNDVRMTPAYHAELKSKLDSATPEPLSEEKYEHWKAKLDSVFAKFDVKEDHDSDIDATYDLNLAISKVRESLRTDYLTYQIDGGAANSKTARLRDLLKSKEYRTNLVGNLMVAEAEFSATRNSDKEFTITVKLNLPAFFKSHPLVAMQNLLEQ